MSNPRWFVRTANGELHGYFRRDILLCDLTVFGGEGVTILELVSGGLSVSYRPVSEESLRAQAGGA